MILGATAGFMVGHQMRGSNKKIGRIWKTNGLLMRAIMGGLGYHLINHSLKERDERIRRELLLNLESFKVQVERSEAGGASTKGSRRNQNVKKPVLADAGLLKGQDIQYIC